MVDVQSQKLAHVHFVQLELTRFEVFLDLFWFGTNVTTRDRIQWFLSQLGDTLCGKSLAGARASVKKNDESIAFALDDVGVSFARDSVGHQSVDKLFRLVVSD